MQDNLQLSLVWLTLTETEVDITQLCELSPRYWHLLYTQGRNLASDPDAVWRSTQALHFHRLTKKDISAIMMASQY